MSLKIIPIALLGSVAACGTVVEEDIDNPQPGAQSCVAADPTVNASFGVDASSWPMEGEPNMGAPTRRTVSAICTVQSVSEAEIALSCSDDAVSGALITIQLSGLPSDFELAIASGSQVVLDHYWQSDGHHIESGQWVVVHDASRSRMLFAAIDYSGVDSTSDQMANLSLDVDDTLCAKPCGDNEYSCTDPHRVAVRAEGDDGARATVLDGTRSQLESAGERYDIVVSSAEGWDCLNCSDQFIVLIAARP